MPNMNIAYRGPDPSLIALTSELRGHYGNPVRPYEFITGYKDVANFSGHNPDSNGVVHAVDIFTDDNGNIPEAEGRALAERLRLIGAATNRFAYLIHDMSAGAPQPMIAGQFNGWSWQAYGGADAHSDHIHVSIADCYWGDPCTESAAVTNDTSLWGVSGGAVPQSGNITPIIEPIQEDDMTPAQEAMLLETMLNARKIVGFEQADATRDQIAAGKLEEVVLNVRKTVYGIGDLKAGLAKLPAVDIAAAIPKDMAAQVIAALSAQLNK